MRQPNLSDRKQVSIMCCMQAGEHQNEIDTEEWMRNEDEDGGRCSSCSGWEGDRHLSSRETQVKRLSKLWFRVDWFTSLESKLCH